MNPPEEEEFCYTPIPLTILTPDLLILPTPVNLAVPGVGEKVKVWTLTRRQDVSVVIAANDAIMIWYKDDMSHLHRDVPMTTWLTHPLDVNFLRVVTMTTTHALLELRLQMMGGRHPREYEVTSMVISKDQVEEAVAKLRLFKSQGRVNRESYLRAHPLKGNLQAFEGADASPSILHQYKSTTGPPGGEGLSSSPFKTWNLRGGFISRAAVSPDEGDFFGGFYPEPTLVLDPTTLKTELHVTYPQEEGEGKRVFVLVHPETTGRIDEFQVVNSIPQTYHPYHHQSGLVEFDLTTMLSLVVDGIHILLHFSTSEEMTNFLSLLGESPAKFNVSKLTSNLNQMQLSHHPPPTGHQFPQEEEEEMMT